MNEQEKNREQVNVRVPKELLSWAKEHARENYDTVSRLMVVALDRYRRQVTERDCAS
jgi:hypothetical protein